MRPNIGQGSWKTTPPGWHRELPRGTRRFGLTPPSSAPSSERSFARPSGWALRPPAPGSEKCWLCAGPARLADLLEHLLQELARLVLVHVLGVHELGREDALGLREHLLLAGRQPLLLVALGEVPHHLGHLEDVAGLHLVSVVLEPPVPVLGHLRAVALEHLDHLIDGLLLDHLAQSDTVGAVKRDRDGHVVVQDLDGQVLAFLVTHLPAVSAHDRPGTVVRVDDLLANFVQGVARPPRQNARRPPATHSPGGENSIRRGRLKPKASSYIVHDANKVL